MTRPNMKAAAILPAFLLMATAQVGAQPASPVMMRASPIAASERLDETAKREVVARLSETLRDRYVFPDVGIKAAALLNARLEGGSYATINDPNALAARLSADLASVANDKHMRVRSRFAPPPAPPPTMVRGEGGILRADKLANDVGYIEVVGFPPPPVFRKVLDRAMTGLAGSKALIIDVRRNGGGAPPSVSYLVSFLVPPGQILNTIVSRTEKTRTFTRESYRSEPTPVSFATVPVYVLTSKATFSGGEEFAYDVQALKRGTIIGEVTGGGANPTDLVDLGHGFTASIPSGRAENPITGTNWEGRGVSPDLRVAAADAFGVAYRKAGGTQAGEPAAVSVKQVFTPRSTPHAGSEKALRRIIAGYVSGKPDYAILAPDVAAEMKDSLADRQSQFVRLGELETVTFNGPDIFGGDEFRLHFARGNVMMALVLGPNGRVLAVSTPMPLPPS